MSGILNSLTTPDAWSFQRFGAVTRRRKEKGHPDLEPLSVFLDQGVVPRASRDDNYNVLGEDLSKYLVVRPNDLVFNKLRTWQGGFGVSRHEGLVSPAYFVCEPSQRVEPRYLHHLLRSTPWLQELTRVSKWMPPSQFDIGWEELRDIPVLLPPRENQRQISDFLDIETGRIDALIDKKRHMIELLEERKSVLLLRALELRGLQWGTSIQSPAADAGLPAGWKVARLSTVLEQLTNGYVGPTRDLLVDEGVKYIQSLHIKDGAIDFSRRPYYVPVHWHDERPRIHLRPGDVLIVQTGDIGQVAVVPPDFGPASCHALQIARVRRDLLVGDYLAAYLRSPFGRQSLLSRVTGALHPHLEGGIRDIP